MRIGIIGIIMVVMMLAMVQNAAAYAVDTAGQIDYEDTTPCESLGWIISSDNLNQTYREEPNWAEGYGNDGYIIWDYLITPRAESDNDYMLITVASPDGKWYGESTVQLKDVWDEVWQHYVVDIVVYEVSVEPETFTMDIAPGWNLISLPLTATDNSVSEVLSTVSQDAVRQYDATTKTFEDATTMDPGTGYFVHVTTAGTWEYNGSSVSSTSPGLESGLNMIGVPNCTMDVGTAMGSADYWYVSRWNADDQKYEVYNPSAPSSFHGFTTMTAGEGYFVSAKSDDSGFEITCSS